MKFKIKEQKEDYKQWLKTWIKKRGEHIHAITFPWDDVLDFGNKEIWIYLLKNVELTSSQIKDIKKRLGEIK